MSKRNKQKNNNYIYEDSVEDISSTNDVKTNDFDLTAGKVPPLSTIKAQIKKAKALIGTDISKRKADFDRLKIAVNLVRYCDYISFDDFGLEDTKEPWKRPSYKGEDRDETSFLDDDSNILDDDADSLNDDSLSLDNDDDIINYFESEEFEKEVEELLKNTPPEKDNKSKYKNIKRRICYEDYKSLIGLNNMYIYKGFFVLDITGKWMADRGFLGSLNINNIQEALQRIIDLQIVEFNIERFLEVAKLFLCDPFVDLIFLSESECSRVIQGLSSFAPLASNKFNIAKYGRHGLHFLPKAKDAGYSFVIYCKGQELVYSHKRRSKTSDYATIIGKESEFNAYLTLRFEVKLQNFASIRKFLRIPSVEARVVPLLDVLNSTAPVILNSLEKISGTPEMLLERLLWLQDVASIPEKESLKDIWAAERFIQILEENNYDLTFARSHILTEYLNVSEKELENINKRANIRNNVLTFLTYKKPKSTTIILDVLNRLYQHYSTSNGDNR